MRRILIAILSLFCMHAQSQSMLSIDDAIAQGLKNNYDILLVKNDAEVLATDYQFANAAFLPQVSADASQIWNRNNSQQNFLDGRKRKANVASGNLSAAINLNWTLFDGLKMFATKARLEEMKNLGELGVKAQVVNAVAQITNNYYNIVRQKQQLKAIEELISINEERVKLADKKLSVGMGSKPELLQARVDLNAQKATHLLQETLIAQLKEDLNQLTGIPAKSTYDVSDSIPLHLSIKYDSISAGIEQANPDLLTAKKNIEIANLSLKERKAERWPSLSFNSAYNFGRVSNGSVVNPEFQPIFNLTKGLNYGLSATVPILTGFNTKRLIKQAGLDIEYQQLTYDKQKSLIDVSINNTYKDYLYQKKALKLEEENIALAKENVFIALERFRQGVSTYLELREAQISLEDAYNRLIAARYNTKLAETELFRLKGSL